MTLRNLPFFLLSFSGLISLVRAAKTLFEDVSPAKTGVTFVHRLDADNLDAYLYHSGYACGGVCIGDVNGDTRPDLFLVSGPDNNALFLNKGGFTFEKSAASVADEGKWSVGAAIADADGDGDLWLNEGGLRFRDALDEFLPMTTWSSMGSDIADINGDGLLDFMVADMAGTTHFKAKTIMGDMNGYRRWVLENTWPRQAMRNLLFINSGAGRFMESAFLSGVARSDWTPSTA